MSLSKIILCDTNDRIIDAFNQEMHKQPIKDLQVEIIYKEFQHLQHYDAIVAAGNSFGVMTGGIDYYIDKYFNLLINKKNKNQNTNIKSIQDKVYSEIKTKFLLEVPVGSSFIVETEIEEHPFIIYSPTMRTPIELSINSNNIYNSTLSALTTAIKHNQNNDNLKIKTLVLSGMGAGTGAVPPRIVSKQMFFAINNALRMQDHNQNIDFEIEIDKTYEMLN